MRIFNRVALLALTAGALLAVPASAMATGGFAADEYPAAVSGSGGVFALDISEVGEFGCTGPSFETELDAPATSLASSEHKDTACKMEGCEFVFRPGSETFDIGPAECGPVKLATGVCGDVAISPQTDLGADYQGSSIDLDASGLTVTLLYPSACGKKGSEHSATLTGTYSLSAENGSEEEIDIDAYTAGVPVGLFMGAGELPEGLNAQGYPVAVSAEKQAEQSLTIFEDLSAEAGTTTCDIADLSAGTFSESTGNFGLSGELDDCEMPGVTEQAEVAMNSCSYVFEQPVEAQEDPFEFAAPSIGCTTEGDVIVINGPACEIKIPEQGLTSDYAEAENEGSGRDATVSLHVPASGMTYTSKGFGCVLMGLDAAGEDGAMAANFALSGTLSE